MSYPFFGYRKVHAMLMQNGIGHNRKKIQRLMQIANLKAVCPGKKTSIRNKEHKVYPYLLKNVDIVRPNQAWQVDLTYIKIRGGYVYLTCLIDIYSRKIMGWNMSPFLDATACINALENALRNALPEIINSDQGCQFTSVDWCQMLNDNQITISMDGKGRWADNAYIERLWRTIKYELVYLHCFETVSQLWSAISKYIDFYNTVRPHQSLGYRCPNQAYEEFKHVSNSLEKIEIHGPFLGSSKNSQIFTNFWS